MGKPANNNKGNSGNTNGGTETSFTKTPQAKDDLISSSSLGSLNYDNLVFVLDILANDLGGNGKSLWSVDDGVNDSGAMDGYEAGDLLTQDFAGDEEAGQNGVMLSLTSDGMIAYDAVGIEGDIVALPEGAVLTNDFIYAIRMGNGTLSWAGASFSIVGINDAPTLQSTSSSTDEDNAAAAIDLSSLGDDVDSDDDGSTLTYTITFGPPAGNAAILGLDFVFDPNGDFETLAAGVEQSFDIGIQAEDSHGATDDAVINVTVIGVNDAPTLAGGSLAADEDGSSVSIDLTALGADIDSDDDGGSLDYSLLNSAPGGSATINAAKELVFDPAGDFQELAAGETTDFILDIQATDSHQATATNSVAVSVTGVNDAPTLQGTSVSIDEDAAGVSVDLSLLGDDVDSDNDGSNLAYTVTAPASGSASVSGSSLNFASNGVFDYLAVGESTTVSLGVTAEDIHGESATNTVEITVNGVNDAPVIDGGSTSAAVTLVPGQTPFTVEQWTGYSGPYDRASLVAEASSRAADYSITSNIIDFTDDPAGFAGDLPGSSPWPAAAANSASGTGHALNNHFFARITANILITAADTYTFRTFNDDGVYLTVNNQLIINDSGIHPEQQFTGSIYLEPGVYPLELFFFENAGEASLELSFSNSAGVYQHVDSSDATANGSLQFSDVDLSDTHSVSVAAVGAAQGTLTAVVDSDTTGSGTGGVVNWEFQIDNGAYQELGQGESTTESFVITVDDGNGGTAQETVTVTINGANDAPEANADSATTDEDTAVTIDVLANDTDPDANDSLTVVSASDGDNGSVAIVNNELVYTPNADFNGSDTFSYTMEDSSGISRTASVSVTVNPVADPAVLGSAEEDLIETDAQQTVSGVLSITDPDAGEEAFNVQSGTAGTYGSFSIDAAGNWSFTTDGALDYLEEGEQVSESFAVSSIDGSTTSVTINITGTADGPTAVADTNSLTASGVVANTDNTVYWVDWSAPTLVSSGGSRDSVYEFEGTITVAGVGDIDVTYVGQATGWQTDNNGTDFYVTRNHTSPGSGPITSTEGAGVFTGPEVANGPSNNDIIRLNHADSARTLTFSQNGSPITIENLFFAIVSMNKNGYLFDQDFNIVSSADSATDGGYFGWVPAENVTKTDLGDGRFGITTPQGPIYENEFHGVLAIENALQSLTWTGQSDEFWNGFTIGTYGIASSTTAAGNLIDNDDQGGKPPAEVSDVNGTAMVGNSVTIELASGAILKVDKDGDYLYDDNNAFGALLDGESHTDTVTYTIEDTVGNTDSATLSVTVYGVDDPAVLGSETVDLTETDSQLLANGVLSIIDPDAGQAAFNEQTGTVGDYGTFSIDAAGNWSFASDGALDYLEDGEQVSETFAVSSIDGSTSSVTINITGTADGPVAVADTNSLSASGPAVAVGNTVNWVDWHTITPTGSGVTDEVTIDGTITLPDRTIGVTYTGQIYPDQTKISPTNTVQYWDANNGSGWLANGDGVYTSAEVANGPGASYLDFIALALADTPRNLTFSEPVDNLFFAVASMNNNGYLFDQPFTVVSSAESSTDRGEWGYTAGITLSENNGQYGISTAGFSPNEFHGVLAINNAVDSLTWVSQTVEYWQGFTVGTYGIATSATVAGNVISNDDQGNKPPAEVSDVNGSAMVGNSVTLNLSSGAILRVDKDGGYLYDDNNAFAALGAGSSHTDTVTYTITDTSGNSDSATLAVTVNGVNDAPQANDDAVATGEDVAAVINIGQLLANDTDIDTGDTKTLVSVQDAVNGTVSLSGSQVIFTPDANFNGDASFTYTMKDSGGETSSASVNVVVNPVPDVYSVTNLVTNGSFEAGLTGWTHEEVNLVNSWQGADGDYTVDLNAEAGGGSVSQTLSTAVGQAYSVGFSLSKNPGSSATETAIVSAAGQSQNYAYSLVNNAADMLWQERVFTFTANSSATELKFEGADPNIIAYLFGIPISSQDAWGPAIDEVVAFANDSVADFDIGLGGDILNLSQALASVVAPQNATAFSGGFLNFHHTGGNTVVQIDPDGGGDGYIDTITLIGVTLTQADSGNYLL